jgi:hypothetical protein
MDIPEPRCHEVDRPNGRGGIMTRVWLYFVGNLNPDAVIKRCPHFGQSEPPNRHVVTLLSTVAGTDTVK